MIWEGNNGGTDAKNHGRVNLAVCPRLAVEGAIFSWLQRLRGSGNHGGLLLHSVDVLHYSRSHQVLPLVVVELTVLEHLNVVVLHEQPAVLHDEEWATDAAGICIYADLTVADVTDHGHLCIDDVHLTTELAQS